MSNHHRRLKPYLEFLQEHDVEVHDTEICGSGHYKITVTANGNRRWLVVPYSTSDRRAFLNWKAQTKRWLRGLDIATIHHQGSQSWNTGLSS